MKYLISFILILIIGIMNTGEAKIVETEKKILTSDQKEILRDIGLTEARIENDELTKREIETVEVYEQAHQFLQERYPDLEFHFVSIGGNILKRNSYVFNMRQNETPFMLTAARFEDRWEFGETYYQFYRKKELEEYMELILREAGINYASFDAGLIIVADENYKTMIPLSSACLEEAHGVVIKIRISGEIPQEVVKEAIINGFRGKGLYGDISVRSDEDTPPSEQTRFYVLISRKTAMGEE